MSTLPITTACYRSRIAALQKELQLILDQLSQAPCSASDLQVLEARVQPIYAAIWAMHAEIRV
jgi:hypothetical protein